MKLNRIIEICDRLALDLPEVVATVHQAAGELHVFKENYHKMVTQLHANEELLKILLNNKTFTIEVFEAEIQAALERKHD